MPRGDGTGPPWGSGAGAGKGIGRGGRGAGRMRGTSPGAGPGRRLCMPQLRSESASSGRDTLLQPELSQMWGKDGQRLG